MLFSYASEVAEFGDNTMGIISVIFSLSCLIVIISGQKEDLLSSKVRQSLIGHLIDDIQSSEKVNYIM